MMFIEECSRREERTAEPEVLPKVRRSEIRQPGRDRESPAKNVGDHPRLARRVYDEAGWIVGIPRQIGVVRIALGKMTERRKDEFIVIAADGAENVARLVCNGIEAFHKSKVAIARGAQQGVEVCTGMIGDSHWVLQTKGCPALDRALG